MEEIPNKSINLLVVEDNTSTSNAIKKSLNPDKYKVLVASSQYEWINIAQRTRITVIIIDIAQPNKEGGEILKKLRFDTYLNKTPLLFIIDNEDKKDITELFSYPTFDFITRPYSITELEIKIKKHIQQTDIEFALAIQIEEKSKQLQDEKTQAIENEEKFRELVESTSDWIWEINADGDFLYSSPKIKELLGYTPEELIGKNAFDLMSVKEAEKVEKVYAEFVQNKKAFKGMINVNLHKDGYEVIIESNGVPILNPNGDLIGYRGIDRDISERKKIEQELLEAKEKAEESDRLKSEFIQNMSHEIRTPMNGIIGFTELLNAKNIEDHKKEYYLSIIKSSSKQLLRVIDDIIEISRLGTKQVKVQLSEVCLNNILLELFSSYNLKAKSNGTPLYFKKGLSDSKSTLFIDALKLKKALSNLLDNSLKFTHEGYIEMGYKLEIGKSIELYVKDTGIGISKEKQKHIFTSFSQGDARLSNHTTGLGLGLSIAKANIELLGGALNVKSAQGEGATFTITLPYTPVKEEVNATDTALDNKAAKDEYKILVVEDDEINYLFLETLLEKKIDKNIAILYAKNGKEAVEIFQETEHICIVFMDLKMPVMDGFEATEKIIAINPDQIVVALTAFNSSSDKTNAKAAGCTNFISKPISERDLEKVLKVCAEARENK